MSYTNETSFPFLLSYFKFTNQISFLISQDHFIELTTNGAPRYSSACIWNDFTRAFKILDILKVDVLLSSFRGIELFSWPLLSLNHPSTVDTQPSNCKYQSSASCMSYSITGLDILHAQIPQTRTFQNNKDRIFICNSNINSIPILKRSIYDYLRIIYVNQIIEKY